MITSSESVSNLSDPDSMKKNRRELRLGDRVLVRDALSEAAGVRWSQAKMAAARDTTLSF